MLHIKYLIIQMLFIFNEILLFHIKCKCSLFHEIRVDISKKYIVTTMEYYKLPVIANRVL